MCPQNPEARATVHGQLRVPGRAPPCGPPAAPASQSPWSRRRIAAHRWQTIRRRAAAAIRVLPSHPSPGGLPAARQQQSGPSHPTPSLRCPPEMNHPPTAGPKPGRPWPDQACPRLSGPPTAGAHLRWRHREAPPRRPKAPDQHRARPMGPHRHPPRPLPPTRYPLPARGRQGRWHP